MALLLFMFTTNSALAQVQCPWQTYAQLPYTINNSQPALAVFQNQLYLAWIAAGVPSQIVVSTSTDGVSWTSPVAVYTASTDLDIVKGYGGGVGMTSSDYCGQLYIGWRDSSFGMWVSRSASGSSWSPKTYIFNFAQSAPALRGDDSSLPIGWAFSAWWDPVQAYQVLTGKFNCDLSSPTFINCLFGDCSIACQDQVEPRAPLWTGGGGVEFKAETRGTNSNPCFDISWYTTTSSGPWPLGGEWSDNGIAGAVDPSTGKAYLSWTCHDEGGNLGGDVCHPDGPPQSDINIGRADPSFSQKLTCTDWSLYNPAMTFFQGKLWLAWLGGGGGPVVASMQPPF